MKFAHKMICLLVLVLSASFGLGGCWLLYSDFAVQRRTVLTADAALHSQICTDVQTDLLDRQRRGLEMDGAVAAARLGPAPAACRPVAGGGAGQQQHPGRRKRPAGRTAP